MAFPITHLEEAQKLSADAEIDLYTVTLRNDPIIFRAKMDDTVTWRGNVYEGMPIQLAGESETAEGDESRPILHVLNPLGIFNEAAFANKLDLAVVRRDRVLRAHLDANVAVSVVRRWYIARVRELISGQAISFELRSLTEGPNHQVPARQFIPPEFSHVSI